MVPISNETGVLSFRQDFNCVERKLLTLFKQTKKLFQEIPFVISVYFYTYLFHSLVYYKGRKGVFGFLRNGRDHLVKSSPVLLFLLYEYFTDYVLL